jgi:hypothetical protein
LIIDFLHSAQKVRNKKRLVKINEPQNKKITMPVRKITIAIVFTIPKMATEGSGKMAGNGGKGT